MLWAAIQLDVYRQDVHVFKNASSRRKPYDALRPTPLSYRH